MCAGKESLGRNQRCSVGRYWHQPLTWARVLLQRSTMRKRQDAASLRPNLNPIDHFWDELPRRLRAACPWLAIDAQLASSNLAEVGWDPLSRHKPPDWLYDSQVPVQPTVNTHAIDS